MRPVWVAVVAITAAYAVVAWSGVEQWKDSGGDDSFAYRDYVERLYRTHELPPRSENYEFSLPPGALYLGVAVTWAFAPIQADRPSPPLQGLPRLLRRLFWLTLVVGGGALLAGARRWQPRWLLGVAAWFAAAGWAWMYLNAAVDNERWLPLVPVSYAAAVALLPATALLAHEIWPARRSAPVLGAAAAALMPLVLISTLYLHPDPPFALLAVLAIVVVVRALRTGLTIGSGAAAGASLAALTTVFVVSWLAFVATLVRFPQRGGDPIKGHYLLFLAPVSAVFAIAAGYALVRRGGWPRLVLLAWTAVYAVSWALTVATAF